MEKTAKITKSTFKNEWENPKGGSIFYHDIELDNGDKGSIGAKEKNPPKLNAGEELTYTIENGKIKAVNKPNFNAKGKGYTPEPYEHKMAGMAFSFAKDLVIADKVAIDKIEALSERIYNWLLSKKQN